MRASRTALAAGIVVACAVQVYLFFIHAPFRVAARGLHPTLIGEFGTAIPVIQTFEATAQGLDEIRLELSAARPVRVQFEWRLGEIRSGVVVNPMTGDRTVDLHAGLNQEAIRFRPIANAAGRSFQLELRRIPIQDGDGGVSLVASLDDSLDPGSLSVAGQQRWGDLIFEARARGDTVAGRFVMTTLRGMPAPLDSTVIWMAILVGFEALVGVFVVRLGRASPAQQETRWLVRRLAVGRAALAIFTAALAGTLALGRGDSPGLQLLDDLYRADLSSNTDLHWTFSVRDSALGGVERRAIFAHPPSAIRWTVQIPPNSRLRTAIGLEEGAWDRSADGVLFGISVDLGTRHTDLLARHVDPMHAPGDRAWIPVDIDLAAFAGETVTLVFRTEPSLAGVPANGGYDWALWSAPRIATAR